MLVPQIDIVASGSQKGPTHSLQIQVEHLVAVLVSASLTLLHLRLGTSVVATEDVHVVLVDDGAVVGDVAWLVHLISCGLHFAPLVLTNQLLVWTFIALIQLQLIEAGQIKFIESIQ